MADINLINKINTTGELDTSMILDTLMYTDQFEDKRYNNYTVNDIVNDIRERNKIGEIKLSDERAVALENVKAYLDKYPDSEVANLVLYSASDGMGDDYKGARGATFYSKSADGTPENVYIAYRGTGEGRWLDNGDAFDKEYSEYQQDAAQYYDYVIEELGVTSESKVIVTGHSKGGNEAQFVTVASKNAHLVDRCISYDGQGFSPEAIEYFKKLYGEEFYEEQLKKMYSISGDNDFVNVLGIKIIPEENTVYIETPTEVNDFQNAHALFDEKGTKKGNLYNYETGEFYATTVKQRDLALLVKSISDKMMKLPPEERGKMSRTIMDICERKMSDEKTKGLGGETASEDDYWGAFANIDALLAQVIFTKEGQVILNKTIDDWLKDKLPFDNGTPEGEMLEFIIVGFIHCSAEKHIIFLELAIYELSKRVAFGAKYLKPVYDFWCDVVKNYKHNRNMLYNQNYRAAQGYLASSSVIELHTDDLRNIADRLTQVNSRLDGLDSSIDRLYKKMKWTDLWTLMTADFKICSSSRIKKCAGYLNDTADRFERVEKKILEMIG